MGVKKTPAQKRKISLAMKKRWAEKKRARSLLTETEKRADAEAKASRRKAAAYKKRLAVNAPKKKAVKKKASQRQVAGDHYVKQRIQPWDVIDEYGLDFFLGNAIKYILRNKQNKLEDLKKAQHYLEKKIEMLGG